MTYLGSDEDLGVCEVFQWHDVGVDGLSDDGGYAISVEVAGVLLRHICVSQSNLSYL